MLLHNDAEMKS